MHHNIWAEHAIDPENTPLFMDLKRLHVWLDYQKDEVWIAHRYVESGNVGETVNAGPPPDVSWSRWAYKSGIKSVHVTPVFPNLPIVIGSEFPLHISPGARIRFFCRIPVWARIGFKGIDYVLEEIPTVKLSKTWFGTPLEGELCYWATTHARRSLEGVATEPYLVNCPIWITNKAQEDLNFENFCLRVSQLDIYLVGNELWSGETHITHNGGDSNSHIRMNRELPSDLGEGELISPARNPIDSGFVMKTFKKIFDDSIFSSM